MPEMSEMQTKEEPTTVATTPLDQHDERTPIGAAWRRLAAAGPHQVAVTDGTVVRTRVEVETRTNRLAQVYRDLGVTKDSLVTIALPSGAEFLESLIAVWKVGATPQPVSHRLPQPELTSIVELADPALVVGLDVPDRTCLPVNFEPDPQISDSPLPDAIAVSLKAPTSGGSTGRPKLIVSTEEATAESLRAFGELVRIVPGSTVLSTAPLSHNGPLFTSAAALLAGCHVVVMKTFDAAEALNLVARHRVNWMYSVPTMLSRIAALPAHVRETFDVNSLQTVITMAAHCPPAVKEFCLSYFGPEVMLELYAATEAQAIVMTDGAGWMKRPTSVGRVVVGQIEVRGSDGERLPPGEVGQLWMRRTAEEPGPYSYLGSTPQRSADGWESVGDLGAIDAEGYLYLADRRDDMIIVGGSNVYPAEVEAALEEHPDVTAACVVGLPDDEYGQVAHAVLNVTTPIPDDEFVAHLRESLLPYKVPRSFEAVSTPLRDEAGKMRRNRVMTEARERLAQWTEPHEPKDRTE